jgi:hypothetical protein
MRRCKIMKLWETYFRMWDRFSDSLTERKTQSEPKEKPVKEEERESSYYGYLCDEGTCIESGV